MASDAKQDLEQQIIELKQKADEVKVLRNHRDELIETFTKLKLEIPLEVKLNVESSIELDKDELRDQIRYYKDENINLENCLNACMKIKDEGEMLMRENCKLKRDLEMLQSGEKLDLNEYIKHVTERLRLLEYERDKFMDRVLNKDVKIDMMTSKLSHLKTQLQEPIKQLRDKEAQGLPLSNEEKQLLKLAELSVTNEELKLRENELRKEIEDLYNEYDELTDKVLNYLEQVQLVDREPLLKPEEKSATSSIFEVSSTRPPSMSTSYSIEIFRTQTYDPLGVAKLGLSASKVTQAQNSIEHLRRAILMEREDL